MRHWPEDITDDEVIDAIRSVPTHYVNQSRFKISTGSLTNWNDGNGWSTSSGGTAAGTFPTTNINAIFDGNSNNSTVNVASICGQLNCTGYTGTIDGTASLDITATTNGTNWFKLVAGMTWSYTGTLTMQANGAGRQVTTAGKALDNLTLNATAGTNGVTLQDAMTVTNALTLTQGALDTGSFALTCASLSSSNSNTRSLTLGSSTVTLSGTGTVWDTSTATNFTLSAASSTITVSNTSSTGKTFAGGGLTYGNLTASGGTGGLTITGSNTFATLTVSGPLTLTGTTTTATSVALTGCTAITGGTLSVASGTVTAPSGCTITNSTASGGATFDASLATDGGGNSGWTFASAAKTNFWAWLPMTGAF